MFQDPTLWLPFVFACLMGFSVLDYVILDGFDLGVGILFPFATPQDRDLMISSIGPFWDANETWLVLAIGILLVAFPPAHGAILTALYLPVAVMLIGLIARGVAFEFRVKAPEHHRGAWNRAFFIGSLSSTLAQGFMLGLYITGLTYTWTNIVFALCTALFLVVGFAFIGATWVIAKTEGPLQRKSIQWARKALWGLCAGIAAVSVASPLASPRVWDRWFSWPEVTVLAILPLLSLVLIIWVWRVLRLLPMENDQKTWHPFFLSTRLFLLAFIGLAYSFYPYIVPDTMTIYDASSAPESLIIILVGTAVVMPIILGYSILAYTVFRGKTKILSYA